MQKSDEIGQTLMATLGATGGKLGGIDVKSGGLIARLTD